MNSKILEAIGLNNIDIAIILIVILAVAVAAIIYCVVLTKKLNELRENYEVFMDGKDAKSLEKAFQGKFKEVEELLKDKDIKSEAINKINDNMEFVIQKCGIVKYDAFKEMGGKLSFALVLLDKMNNGFVINSMHSREGCYTYIKEIVKGESYIALGDEEETALKKALGKEN